MFYEIIFNIIFIIIFASIIFYLFYTNYIQYNIGCKDQSASNYTNDPNVLHFGELCKYDEIGCTNPNSINYDKFANKEGPCIDKIMGCPKEWALKQTGTVDDGSCITPYTQLLDLLMIVSFNSVVYKLKDQTTYTFLTDLQNDFGLSNGLHIKYDNTSSKNLLITTSDPLIFYDSQYTLINYNPNIQKEIVFPIIVYRCYGNLYFDNLQLTEIDNLNNHFLTDITQTNIVNSKFTVLQRYGLSVLDSKKKFFYLKGALDGYTIDNENTLNSNLYFMNNMYIGDNKSEINYKGEIIGSVNEHVLYSIERIYTSFREISEFSQDHIVIFSGFGFMGQTTYLSSGLYFDDFIVNGIWIPPDYIVKFVDDNAKQYFIMMGNNMQSTETSPIFKQMDDITRAVNYYKLDKAPKVLKLGSITKISVTKLTFGIGFFSQDNLTGDFYSLSFGRFVINQNEIMNVMQIKSMIINIPNVVIRLFNNANFTNEIVRYVCKVKSYKFTELLSSNFRQFINNTQTNQIQDNLIRSIIIDTYDNNTITVSDDNYTQLIDLGIDVYEDPATLKIMRNQTMPINVKKIIPITMGLGDIKFINGDSGISINETVYNSQDIGKNITTITNTVSTTSGSLIVLNTDPTKQREYLFNNGLLEKNINMTTIKFTMRNFTLKLYYRGNYTGFISSTNMILSTNMIFTNPTQIANIVYDGNFVQELDNQNNAISKSVLNDSFPMIKNITFDIPIRDITYSVTNRTWTIRFLTNVQINGYTLQML